jgi:hypothetical protein
MLVQRALDLLDAAIRRADEPHRGSRRAVVVFILIVVGLLRWFGRARLRRKGSARRFGLVGLGGSTPSARLHLRFTST